MSFDELNEIVIDGIRLKEIFIDGVCVWSDDE